MRQLIVWMASENETWGAPRIHGELAKLGFSDSERTVSRYLPRIRPGRGTIRAWGTFLRNHREALAAMDFFTVPTVTYPPRPAEDRPLRYYGASDGGLGNPAAPGGVSVRYRAVLLGVRPRFDLLRECHLGDSRDGRRAEAHRRAESLAERRRRALDWELPA